MNNFFTLIIFVTLIVSCMDYYDSEQLSISNKSKSTIFSIISPNDNIAGSSFYSENAYHTFHFEPIKPNQKIENHDRPRDWKSYFEKIPDKKIRIFIVEQDSVVKYGWKKIFEKQLFSKKYMLLLSELEKNHWEVQFK